MIDNRIPLSFFLPEEWKIKKEPSQAYIVSEKDGGKISSGCCIGDYEILEMVGAGGSCLCYKALDLNSGNFVIIKELYPYNLAADGLIIRSGSDIFPVDGISDKDRKTVFDVYSRGFTHESTVTESIRYRDDLSGPNNDPRFFSSHVIQWEERIRTGALNQYYLVIETHAGFALKDIILHTLGTQRVVECLDITTRILESVETLHKEKHRLHLDISPSNLFVSSLKVGTGNDYGGNVIILIDYGSSFAIDENGHITTTGEIFSASPGYMAPELQTLEMEKIGPQTDLFSVAKILQWLLTLEGNSKARSWKARAASDIHIKALPNHISSYLINEVSCMTSTKRSKDVESMILSLATLREIVLGRGIHPVLIAANAERIANTFSNLNDDILCEVCS